MNTDLEITLEFLDSPTEVEFFAVAGAPGRDGADGAPGRDGADGHTPVITASKQGKVTTISVDGSAVAQILDGADGQPGQDGQDGSPGQDGADGHSPVVTASKFGKVTTVSVDGSPIATINDGNDGQDGQDGSDGQDGYTPVRGTDYWTAADKAEIVEEAAEAVDVPVTDVQVNGTSVLSSGVANILMANYVGELLYDETTTEDLTELIANTDLSGQPFEVTKLIAIFNAGLPTTGTRDSFYGAVYFKSNNGSNYQDSFPSLQYVVTTSPLMSKITITAYPNMPMEQIVINAVSDGNTQSIVSMVKQSIAKSITGIRIYQSGSTKSLIPAGSRLKIYGIRA